MDDGRSIKVMLVDDNPADIELTRDYLDHGILRPSIVTSADGQQAIEHLEDSLRRSESLPDLIVTDLNMPRLDGRGFLALLRAREEFKGIPVVVLTSSDAEQDVVKSYELGARCHVTKPMRLEEFDKVVQAVESFFLPIEPTANEVA